MKIGDKVYYVNSGRQIDIYTVTKIENDEVFIACPIDDQLSIKTSFNINDFNSSKLPRIFDNELDAIKLKRKLDEEYEKERQARFDKILEDALNSVTLDTVEKYGTLLKEKKTEYEPFYSDAPGGEWYEAKLYLYNGIYYIIAYKCTDYPTERKECIKFCER